MALRVPQRTASAETPRLPVSSSETEAGSYPVSTEQAGHRPISATERTALDLDRLAAVIHEAKQPVSIQELSRQAVRSLLVTDSRIHAYAPGRRFRVGERVRLLDGRIGDVLELAEGTNEAQGSFTVVTLRMKGGETFRLAAEVPGAPETATPAAVSDELVSRVMDERGADIAQLVRQALACDPRFITLYTKDGEYGCLREFFPPMSPDVLDAALSVLLDTFFDQLSIEGLTGVQQDSTSSSSPESTHTIPALAELLFVPDHLDDATPSEDDPLSDDERRTYYGMSALWARAEQLGEGWDASQMARVFVQPILRALGWSSVPLQSLCSAPAGAYALCADDGAAAELYARSAPDAKLSRRALAVVQTAAWAEALDQPGVELANEQSPVLAPREDMSAAVPAHRLVGVLRDTGVSWGILTNGRIWRVYASDANSVVRTFYQLDLADVFDGRGEMGHDKVACLPALVDPLQP